MTKEKAFRYFFLAVVGLSALLLTLSLLLSSGRVQGKEAAPPQPLYTLRITQGRIGVFPGDSVEAQYYLDTPPANLPDYDRELLENGIPVYTEEELNERIQDLDE